VRERRDGGPGVGADDLELRRPGFERREIPLELAAVGLDKDRRPRAAGEGFQSDRAAPGEEIEEAAPADRVLQDVEECLAGAR